jgi:hypothetical protein
MSLLPVARADMVTEGLLPDCTPIEAAFSKVKQCLRRAEPRTDDDLRAAIWATFATITTSDAAGWFARRGYLPRHPSS